MTEKQIRTYKNLSFLGIFGLSGLNYFIDYDLQNLFNLSYLAFLAYIPLYRELKKGVDEKTEENIAKSNRIAAIIAVGTLLILGIIPNILYHSFGVAYSPSFFIATTAIGFFCAIITQVCAFFYYERK